MEEVFYLYSVWAFMMALVTAILRPFISIKQVLTDSLITFLFSFLCGLILEYFDIPVPVKCGLSGVAGLFATLLYGIIIKLLNNIKEDPGYLIKQFKELRDGFRSNK